MAIYRTGKMTLLKFVWMACNEARHYACRFIFGCVVFLLYARSQKDCFFFFYHSVFSIFLWRLLIYFCFHRHRIGWWNAFVAYSCFVVKQIGEHT